MRNLECAQKSTGNKSIANFTIKEIVFQTEKILFGRKLIVAQNRELNNKEMLANAPYSLYTIEIQRATLKGEDRKLLLLK